MANQYIIDWSDTNDKPSFVLLPGEEYQLTSLRIYGKGSVKYGEGLNENAIRLLENFSHSIPPPMPTKGQKWYDSGEYYIRVQNGTAGTDRAVIQAGITAGDSVVQIQATLTALYSPDPSPYDSDTTNEELLLTSDQQGWSIVGGGIATTSRYGAVRIATDVEALALTTNESVLTPYSLSLLVSTVVASGILELATPAEADALTDNTKAINPWTLNQIIATDTKMGLVRFATEAEALAGVSTDTVLTASQIAAMVPIATTEVRGKVELATQAEADALTDNTYRIITPDALSGVVATTTKKGIIRLATDAEALAGASTTTAITSYQVALAVLQATTTVIGKVELATGAEANALTDQERAVTPFALNQIVATTAKKGLVTLATGAEAYNYSNATKAVTPLSLASVIATDTKKGLVRLATEADFTSIPVSTSTAVTPGMAWNKLGGGSLVGAIASWPSTTDPATLTGGCWVWANGDPYDREDYAAAFNKLNLPVTTASFSASTNTFTTETDHNMKDGNTVMFSNTGTIPGGITANQAYTVDVLNNTSFSVGVDLTSGSAGLFTAVFQASFWGLGDGTTTFNVPLIEEFERPILPTSSRLLGSYQSGEILSHTHTVNISSTSGQANDEESGQEAWVGGSHTSTAAGGTETRPKNVGLFKIFKIK